MAKLLKLRRGTTTQHSSFTGAEGEVTVDTDKETLVVHDGSTAGGHPVAAEDMANVSSASIAGRLAIDSIATTKIAGGALPTDVTVASANIVDGTIVNADVNASAAIAGTKISPNFGSQSVVTTGNITLSDSSAGGNNRAVFGASGDLQVWHDGSNSYIADEGTGALRILGSAIQLKNVANNEIGVEFTENGSVDLYHDNSKKLETTSSGVSVTGSISSSGNISLVDTGALQLGTSNDFTLTHSGTNSIIDSNTGTLIIRSDGGGTKLLSEGNIILRDNDDTTNMIRCLNGTQVELYYNGSKKFETTNGGSSVTGNLDVSSGVDVTGNITVTGTVDGRDLATDGSKLDGIEAGATADQTGAEIASALGAQSIYTTGNIGRDANDHIAFTDNTQMDIYINNNNEFRFEADGDFHADGDVYAFSTTTASDENLKKDITIVGDAVTKVEALKGVTFKWKKNDADSAGVIAQDVEKVLPEVVRSVNDPDGNTYKAVNYAGLTSILIEAVKDLSARVKALEAK